MSTAYLYIWAAWLLFAIPCSLCVYLWDFPSRGKFATCVSISLLSAMIAIGGGYWETTKRYELTHLTPDSADAPRSPPNCVPPADAFSVFLGDKSVIYTKSFPEDIIIMGKDYDGRPYSLLRINKNGDTIGIDLLRIFDHNGNEITNIHQDEWWRNSNFRVSTSEHSLTAYDNSDQNILYVDYVNRRTLYVTGLFIRPAANGGIYAERITKSDIEVLSPSHVRVGSLCITNPGGSVFHFY